MNCSLVLLLLLAFSAAVFAQCGNEVLNVGEECEYSIFTNYFFCCSHNCTLETAPFVNFTYPEFDVIWVPPELAFIPSEDFLISPDVLQFNYTVDSLTVGEFTYVPFVPPVAQFVYGDDLDFVFNQTFAGVYIVNISVRSCGHPTPVKTFSRAIVMTQYEPGNACWLQREPIPGIDVGAGTVHCMPTELETFYGGTRCDCSIQQCYASFRQQECEEGFCTGTCCPDGQCDNIGYVTEEDVCNDVFTNETVTVTIYDYFNGTNYTNLVYVCNPQNFTHPFSDKPSTATIVIISVLPGIAIIIFIILRFCPTPRHVGKPPKKTSKSKVRFT
jgi:hypothetical protein